MDSHDYGHHASGYRKADGGRYPLGNGICSLVAFIGVPIRLICLLEAEAGVE